MIRIGLALALLLAGCAPKTAPAVDEKPPAIGSQAPDFTLPDAHGGEVTLSQAMKKGPVLLIFYLGYSCPRCVAHLRELADQKHEFDEYDTQILAISPDTVAESQDSIKSFGDFPFPMLSDPQMKVAKTYGLVFHPDTMFHGAFIIDTHGVVRFAVKSSHPYDDAEGLLDCLQKIDAENR